MGYEKEKVERAIKAANGSIDLAFEYLNDNNQIELEKLLNNEILKNKKLVEENNNLKNLLNKNNSDIIMLRNQLQNLINENNNLKNLLNNQNIDKNNYNNLKEENNNLKYNLKIKDNEINNLKYKLLKFEPTCNINDIIVINFISSDQNIHCGIKSFLNETFAEVEEKLYKKFNEYRNTNNIFLFKGNVILRFKTILENKIYDGDIITLSVPGENE